MPKKTNKQAEDFIEPLNINGLEGRMMHLPAPRNKNRELLIVYGHHAMLERWFSLAQNFNDFGAVTMPDLPGFGGMDSFYTIGRRPTIDNFADYLAAFVKLRYRRKRVSIVGISFGFLVVTRMLQKYPELTKKVDVLVSIVGFMHRDDFVYSTPQRQLFRRATRLFATRPVAVIIRYGFLNKFMLRQFYMRLPNSKRRFIEVTEAEFNRTMEFEVQLWQANDVRTHWLTTSEFLNIDNCQTRVKLPIYHVASKHDHYFDNEMVKQHMQVVFKPYKQFIAGSKAHTPSILADVKAVQVFLPAGLRKVLNKS